MKELICISCPRGCHLKVDEKTLEVTGNSCPRGKIYGISEVTNPVRIITSTVKISGASSPRVSVKTDKPIAKNKMFEVMKLLDKVELKSPVNIGDIVLSNILGTDVNIVVTKKM
ncbi:MAG: DUF1667 domain-containing protein [Bacilli bacterium]